MRAAHHLHRARTSILLLLVAACDNAPTSNPSEAQQLPSRGGIATADLRSGGEAPDSTIAPMSLTLPYSASASTALGGLFDITQQGTGGGGAFRVSNPNSGAPALFAGSAGAHYTLNVFNTGAGRAGLFSITSASNSNTAVEAQTAGTGYSVHGLNTGTGTAGFFQITNASSPSAALWGTTSGSGDAVVGITAGTGRAGFFRIFSGSNSNPALHAQTGGTGTALMVNHTGPSGALAAFQSGGVNRIRFTRAGKGLFNGGTQVGGADVAEAFEVEGSVRAYEPGDVLVISTRNDRRVERSTEPYSTLVVGVYATKPGVLLTERGIGDGLDDTVPLGVVGVIPTKVSAENGAIRRGDILVTARTPGHAMRAEPVRVNGVALYPSGSLLGKALEPFAGSGTGVIRVLVNVK